MAKEDEPTEVESSVQYKRFENSDDETKTPESTTSSPAEGSTSDDKDNETGGQRDASGKGDIGPKKEVVLQMNGSAARTEPAQEPAWNWLNLVISIASIFCCSVCGVLATVTSVLAYVDHRVGDFSGAQRKRVASYGLAVAALVVGVVCMVIVVVVAIHFDNHD